MQVKLCGLAFSIKLYELEKLDIMPENYSAIHDKDKDGIIIFYPIKAPFDSFKNWQWFGQIKIRIERIFKTVEFRHVHDVGEYAFTVKSFSDSFKTGDDTVDFVQLPKPYYPSSKDFNELKQKLYFYAKRLFYYSMFNYELLLAMAIKFNELNGNHYSMRQIKKLAISIYEYDRSSWEKKKGVFSNYALNKCKTDTALKRKNLAYKLAPLFTDRFGVLDLSSLSSATNIPVKTLYRYGLRKKLSPCSGHITKQCENFSTEVPKKGGLDEKTI